MNRKLLPLLVAAVAAGAVLVPVHLLADIASCSVTMSSYADAVINPSRGEDTEFFVSTGGVPNVMFVLDTSGSMRRLPKDGAAMSWGSFGGTGAYGCSNVYANQATFNSACGTTTLDGSRYNPSPGNPPPDFADAKDAAGKNCPFMTNGGQAPGNTKPGFDPDFYGGDDGSDPWFFEKDKVFHDAIYSPVPSYDGWTDWQTKPAKDSGGNAYTSWSDFCAQWSGTPAKETSCKACMRDQGYFFDGSFLPSIPALSPSCGSTADCTAKNAGTCIKDATGNEYNGPNDNSATCRLPHVWLAGNFLNFYPPKFILARKVLKDVLQSVRKVRLGLTVFNMTRESGGDVITGQGGALLNGLNPGCEMFGRPSNFDSNRGSIKNALNDPFFNLGGNGYSFYGYTPLAETLLNVGQLYHNVDSPWFGDAFDQSGFDDATTTSNNKAVCFSCQASAALIITDGIPTRDGRIPGPAFAANPMTLAVANAMGTPQSLAGMAGYNITGISSTDCPVCNTAAEAADTSLAAGTCIGQQSSGACDGNDNPIPAYLPKVAWYLNNLDLRPDTEEGADKPMTLKGKQTISTYTIGLGTSGNASKILEHTAQAGGGLYNGGSGTDVTDAKSLKDAIMRALEDVNTRSTSFGAASVSTLQVATTQGVLIPRFEPSRNAHWDGHLYSFDLYSEFAGGCRPVSPATASGPANNDYDCDGKCSSVFLKDADGHFIQEDSTGAFKKNLDRAKAACGNGSQCSAANCSEADPDDAARPYWDAGSKLAPVKTTIDPVSQIPVESTNPDFEAGGPLEWYNRKIYTVVDDTAGADGKFTSADPVLDLSALTATQLAALVPYLNLKGTRYCQSLATRLGALQADDAAKITMELSPVVLNSTTLAPVSPVTPKSVEYTTCAEVLLEFVRGADIFKERSCPGYPTRANPSGRYCTRKYQLGDIFHSSPIEVWPPLPSDGWYCPRGLHPQCLLSIYSGVIDDPSQATPANANAYDDYAKSDRYKNRKKFVVVGANDGMLHAIRIARNDPDAGEEIWAFIPPDLLAKLRMLTENVHQFYVDATPMVRDVWLDDWDNARELNALTSFPTPTANDGVREAREFHTVVVAGERRGGTHYFALDITETLAQGTTDYKPKFLWLYPQPNDPVSLQMGETYAEFVPKPPPIGPVRIDRGLQPCAAGSYPTGSRCFEERWIVFLSGGFDPQFTKGRGVYMVDVATGETLWEFSQASSAGWTGSASDCGPSDDPACHLNYPVAATVGMVMWGDTASALYAGTASYFDTATFGDTGGQLWTLRFAEPGQRHATTGKVTNWYGARAFQDGLSATTPECGLGYCEGQPFFFITSNTPVGDRNFYRTLNGTGDRYNVLDPVGGVCGPDNIRACLLKGCTVTIADVAGGPGAVYGIEPMLGKQTYQADHPAECTSVDPSKYRYELATAPGTAACTTLTSKVDGITITCPKENTCSGAAESTVKRASVICTSDSCSPAASNDFGIQIDLKGNPDKRNWFYSVLVFEETGSRAIFSTPEGAQAYDAARLTQRNLTNVNAADALDPTSTAYADALATPEGQGWSYYFDHGLPSGGSPIRIAGVNHDVFRTDERTAAVSTVEMGCAFWNTLQTGIPTGAYDTLSGCPINSPCKAGRAQISYMYGADAATGALCLKVNGVLARTQKNETLVPPHIGKMVAYVGEGQVAFGLTSVRVPQGGANVQLGDVQDIAATTQWLPVDREAHECRHAPKDGSPGYVAPPATAVCRPP